MPSYQWQELVDRARVYLADDHNETPGYLTTDAWLRIARVEFQELWRRWMRQGIVRQMPTDTPFSGVATVSLTGVYAVVGVAEDMSSYMRVLVPAQSSRGAYPYWVASGEINGGKASSWAATGTADNFLVELSPRDVGSTYVVRWLPVPALPTALSDSVDLPFGTEERLVLGIARRALLKESGASPLMERLIQEADAEISFAASGRLDADSPRIRRVRPNFHRRRWPQLSTNQFPSDPNYWMYP